jgi:hypothetical protein
MDHLRNCWRSKLVKKFLQIQLLPCNMGAQIETRKQQPICTFCVPISVMRNSLTTPGWSCSSTQHWKSELRSAIQHWNLSSGLQSNTENLSSGLQPNTENLSSVTQPNTGNYLSFRFATQHWKSELRFANQTLEIWAQALKPNTGNYLSF